MNAKYDIAELIALYAGAALKDSRRPTDATQHMHVAREASDAALRLSEGLQALGCLLTGAAAEGVSHAEFERAGMLLKDVSGIVSALSGLAGDSMYSAAAMQEKGVP